jgi:hypothetical protein
MTTNPATTPQTAPPRRLGAGILVQVDDALLRTGPADRVLVLGIELATAMWPAPDGQSANPVPLIVMICRGVALAGPDKEIVSWKMLPSWTPDQRTVDQTVAGILTDVRNLRTSLLPAGLRKGNANGRRP